MVIIRILFLYVTLLSMDIYSSATPTKVSRTLARSPRKGLNIPRRGSDIDRENPLRRPTVGRGLSFSAADALDPSPKKGSFSIPVSSPVKEMPASTDAQSSLRNRTVGRGLSFSKADDLVSSPKKGSLSIPTSSPVKEIPVSPEKKVPLKVVIKRTGPVITASMSSAEDKPKPDMKGFTDLDKGKEVIPALISSPVKIDILEKAAEDKDDPAEEMVKIYSTKDNLPYKIRDMFLDEGFKYYKGQAFVCNESSINSAMKTATAKGDRIDIEVGPHSANKIDSSTVTSLKRDPSMHGKNLVAFDKNPNDGSPKKWAFLGGSPNWSHNIFANGNKELLVKVMDKEFCQEAHRLMASTSPVKTKKEVVEKSPTKMNIYSSKHVKLNESRAKRIEKVTDKSDDDRSILYSTMNINDESVTNALCAAAKSGANTRIIVHKSALTSNGIPLLEKIEKAGGIVLVYYPKEGSYKINHSKYLVRNNSLLSVGNANTTQEGDDQKNLEMYFYDKNAIADTKKFHYETEKECIPLNDALKRNEEDTKKRKERQKARAEAKKKAAEDKKKGIEVKSDDSKGTDTTTKKSLKRKASDLGKGPVKKKTRT